MLSRCQVYRISYYLAFYEGCHTVNKERSITESNKSSMSRIGTLDLVKVFFSGGNAQGMAPSAIEETLAIIAKFDEELPGPEGQ